MARSSFLSSKRSRGSISLVSTTNQGTPPWERTLGVWRREATSTQQAIILGCSYQKEAADACQYDADPQIQILSPVSSEAIPESGSQRHRLRLPVNLPPKSAMHRNIEGANHCETCSEWPVYDRRNCEDK